MATLNHCQPPASPSARPQDSLETVLPVAVIPYLSGLQRLSLPRAGSIYRPGEAADAVYLLCSGRVKISRIAPDQRETVLAMVRPGELFGEGAAAGQVKRDDVALALDASQVARWPAADFLDRLAHDPQLAHWWRRQTHANLLRAQAQIQALACDPIPRRLARILIEHGQRFGTPLATGRVRTLPLTHEVLAQHVATSREIITHYMNDFREKGRLDYTRKFIDIVPERLQAVLGEF